MSDEARARRVDLGWRAWPHTYAETASRGRWQPYRWLTALSRLIGGLIKRGNARIIVNGPPRSGKTEFFGHWLPTWFLDAYPERWVMLCGYGATLAEDYSRMVRDEMVWNPYTITRAREDTRRAADWKTTRGGGMRGAGVGGPIMGRGGHLMIISDPVKTWEEATSITMQEKIEAWYKSTFRTRLEPGGSIVLDMMRWTKGDISGRLLKEMAEEWVVFKLPAIAKEGDPLGRKPGEALCPERYPLPELLKTKKAVGSRVWRAVYEQEPTEDEGNIYKRDWWRFYVVAPAEFDEILQSWDMSFKDKAGSSYVVGQAWGRKGGNFYLLDQVREQMNYTATRTAVKTFSGKWPQILTKLVEDKANGPAIISDLKDLIPGFIAVDPHGSKVARAEATAPLVEAGNVFLPDPSIAPWVHDFVEEHTDFPFGLWNDQVDAQSQALMRLSKRSRVVLVPPMADLTQESAWSI